MTVEDGVEAFRERRIGDGERSHSGRHQHDAARGFRARERHDRLDGDGRGVADVRVTIGGS